jgi:hypothetical protein
VVHEVAGVVVAAAVDRLLEGIEVEVGAQRRRRPRPAESRRAAGRTVGSVRLLAIDSIAAHCHGCSAACSCTNRIARSRSSGEYRLGRPMAPSADSQGKSPPTIPVRFNLEFPGFCGQALVSSLVKLTVVG